VVRLFLRGIRNGHIPCATPRLPKGKVIAQHINEVWSSLKCSFETMDPKKKGEKPTEPTKVEWTPDDVKNAGAIKRWERGVVIPTAKLEELLEALALAFNADFQQAKDEIFAKGLQEEVSRHLAIYVAQAVLQAPGLGLRPFTDLFLKELLPGKAAIARLLHPYLTEADVNEAERKPFLSGQGWSSDQPKIVRLFRRLGVTGKDAEACARLLAPPQPKKDRLPRNPAVTRCLECFVHALFQTDIVQQSLPPIMVFDRLRWYGLKRHRYYSLRRSKFTPNSLTDTPENRRQISKMAAGLELDPVPIMDALLDK
jgi:hypothetical protein